MTKEQNNNNNKQQPSQELFNLLVELKMTISKLKELYKTIDKKALEEGFTIDDIYELANITDASTKAIIETTTTTTTPNQTTITTTTDNTTNNSNNENEETKYFQRYFQHFQ
jgi:hypothetical protein